VTEDMKAPLPVRTSSPSLNSDEISKFKVQRSTRKLPFHSLDDAMVDYYGFRALQSKNECPKCYLEGA
jgi:hypothetical protein